MFEQKHQKLLPTYRFLGRMVVSFGLAMVTVLFALGAGVLGYHYTADLPWIDALLNAAMILTGMGPVNPMVTPAAKLFASGYALFSGVVFLSAMGIVLSPIIHRIMHKFHADDDRTEGGAEERKTA
jgi:predicted membrane-bound spermidine synthase